MNQNQTIRSLTLTFLSVYFLVSYTALAEVFGFTNAAKALPSSICFLTYDAIIFFASVALSSSSFSSSSGLSSSRLIYSSTYVSMLEWTVVLNNCAIFKWVASGLLRPKVEFFGPRKNGTDWESLFVAVWMPSVVGNSSISSSPLELSYSITSSLSSI